MPAWRQARASSAEDGTLNTPGGRREGQPLAPPGVSVRQARVLPDLSDVTVCFSSITAGTDDQANLTLMTGTVQDHLGLVGLHRGDEAGAKLIDSVADAR